MLKSKQELVSFLEKECEKIVFDKEACEKIREYMYIKHAIPTGTTMDMIARNVLDGQTEFVLFCLIDGLDFVSKTEYQKEFFTDIEINQYKKEKIDNGKMQFPIIIPCNQVVADQWIGAVTSEFFMDLRKAQLIKYNANAQRIMKKIIQGENILFKLIPNKTAIRAIKHLMQSKQYIPTSITLNIPYDSDAEFYYNQNKKELVVKSIDAFDISDGYHRYLAMCELSDIDPDFVYPMEIRITNFTDEKMRQFIFQEDQKTKMARSDSNTMNTNRASNIVIDRLNEMSTFDFKGQIGRNEGTINFAAMSDFIEYFYFKGKKTYSNVDIRNVANEIRDKFNALSEYDSSYITKVLGFKELALIFYIFSIESNLNKAVVKIDKALKGGIAKKIYNGKISKPLFNSISALL